MRSRFNVHVLDLTDVTLTE